MTRYTNPLPQTQVPQTQGRPAAPGGPRLQQRPQQPAYPDQGYGDLQAAPHDPYAALRPDGYGYAQQAPAPDPYGLAGYTAPQPPAGQPAFAPRSQPAPQYAQQPYAAPAPQPGYAPQPSPYGHAFAPQQSPGLAPAGYLPPNEPQHDQWNQQGLGLDPRGYGPGFGVQDQWGTGDPYAEHAVEPSFAPTAYQSTQPAQQGSFDQRYAEDEEHYEEEPRRAGWKKITMLIACTAVVGGVLTFAYSSIMGTGTGGPTPLVKGVEGPSKVKPSDPGGKQFAYTDSKVMGRLDGGAASSAEADASGVRKVPVVTVGRDGSIQAPDSVEQQEPTRAVVSVPGLTVIDGFGGGPGVRPPSNSGVSPTVQMVTASAGAAAQRPVEPAQKSKRTAELLDTGASDATVEPTKAAATQKTASAPKKEKVAALTPPPAATGPQPTGAGYVAVLASVPASNSSRIDALKQFADMQQKYGVILQNKTPDVQEADLGAKGTYHRLLVGPPGSRDAASSVCTQLKAEGYSGCWVTAY